MNTRSIATVIITKVIINHKSLDKAISQFLVNVENPKDTALIKELCYGTLRWYYRLDKITQQLLHKPLQKKHTDILCLLYIGLYQILYTRVPHYAAVSETVNATKYLNKSWAKSLLNKTLRKFIQNKNEILAKVDKTITGKYAFPVWIIESIQEAWPEDWEDILSANNTHPPMFLRVNRLKTSRDNYLSRLQQNEMKANIVPEMNNCIQIEKPVTVENIIGFKDGYCSVQDISGQIAASILNLKPDQRVLDACAAPGSKTCHILESEPNLDTLVAIDIDSKRLDKITENVTRLDLPTKKLQLINTDACNTQRWWDGQFFNRILLDAPCSATGVIRRHPDVKILRKKQDIQRLVNLQLKMLNTLWPLLVCDGLLLYATCSILPEENDNNIEIFTSQHKDAHIEPLTTGFGKPSQFGRQLLPTIDGSDGFLLCTH